MEVRIKKLNSTDADEFIQLIKIFHAVFETENAAVPDRSYLQDLLSKADFLVFVAKEGEVVTGGLTVYILHSYYIKKPVAYIYDVGVLEIYQRKGIGKQLIGYLKQFCKDNDFDNAYVEAEADDIAAIEFYRKTQASDELKAVHLTYSFSRENAKGEKQKLKGRIFK
jgi:aminoglycoside 3-N-acetyltransferase I